MDREVAFEDAVAAVLDLANGVETAQVHLLALFHGKPRPQQQRPVVQALADERRTEPIGGLDHCRTLSALTDSPLLV